MVGAMDAPADPGLVLSSSLLRLAGWLQGEGYAFSTVTPATHERVNARPQARHARNLRDVFVTTPVELIPDDTLLEALNYGGGPGVQGATQILLRAAVASLLNASSPDVSFPVSVGHVVNTTIDRIESQYRPTILTRATYFDSINNLGCPLGLAP